MNYKTINGMHKVTPCGSAMSITGDKRVSSPIPYTENLNQSP